MPVLVALASAAHGQPATDLSHRQAREAPEWVRDAVLDEAFPRAFSPTGDPNGVTARLD